LVLLFRVHCCDVGVVGVVQQAGLELFQTEAGSFISNGRCAGVSIVVLFMEKFRFEWSVPGFTWAALGGFFAFIGFLTFFAALDQGKASTVVTLSALYPLITILLSILFLHERLTPRQGIGIVFALIASVLLAA